MELTCERRVDVKGRDYFFLRPAPPLAHRGDEVSSMMSATVFPAPSGKTTAIYIWWRKGFIGGSGPSVQYKRWVKRYLWSNERNLPFVGFEVVKVLDAVMSEIRYHTEARQRWEQLDDSEQVF